MGVELLWPEDGAVLGATEADFKVFGFVVLLFFQTEGRFCTVLLGKTKLSGLGSFFVCFFKKRKKAEVGRFTLL